MLQSTGSELPIDMTAAFDTSDAGYRWSGQERRWSLCGAALLLIASLPVLTAIFAIITTIRSGSRIGPRSSRGIPRRSTCLPSAGRSVRCC